MARFGTALLLVMFALVQVGCGDDDDGSASADAGTRGVDSGSAIPDSGTPLADGSSPGTDAGQAGGGVQSCEDLCDLTPTSTTAQGVCTAGVVEGLGYDTDNGPCNALGLAFATGNATAAQCNACYEAIDITDADCVSAHGMCF